MSGAELDFDRPIDLQADAPPEARGIERDGVRLLVTDASGNSHHRFHELPTLLRSGDLLVVNESATLPASLPARAKFGDFWLNLSTDFGEGVWLAEPRWSPREPGPVPLAPGDQFDLGTTSARVVGEYPNVRRLLFIRSRENLIEIARGVGRPIRYGYLRQEFPLDLYQTCFSRVPGSAEMPSAARPFTPTLMDRLRRSGIQLASIVLHAGVSSLELSDAASPEQLMFPEPFEVPVGAARAINQARQEGRRVIAVGTTVVRALESAWDGCGVRPARGFTRLWLHPGSEPKVIDGLISGFHDPRSTHLALLYSFVGAKRIRASYREAVEERYLWHEFGDSQLVWRN